MTRASADRDRVPVPSTAAAALEWIPLGGTSLARRSTAASMAGRLLGIGVLFGVWEAAARLGWLDPRTLGAPSSVIGTGWEMARDATLPRAIWA